MARRIMIAVPIEVYRNLVGAKKRVEKDMECWAGKSVSLTMPKFINALVKKNQEISSILPFNVKSMVMLSKKKRGEYE